MTDSLPDRLPEVEVLLDPLVLPPDPAGGTLLLLSAGMYKVPFSSLEEGR